RCTYMPAGGRLWPHPRSAIHCVFARAGGGGGQGSRTSIENYLHFSKPPARAKTAQAELGPWRLRLGRPIEPARRRDALARARKAGLESLSRSESGVRFSRLICCYLLSPRGVVMAACFSGQVARSPARPLSLRCAAITQNADAGARARSSI